MVSVPYAYECDVASGFVPDPNEHKRVGYVTALNGLGLAEPLRHDLQVSIPASLHPAYKGISVTPGAPDSQVGKLTVVGVLEKFEWEGGVGHPVQMDFYVSPENASQIKALQQAALKTTAVNAFGWWIYDYDQETKMWYEQAFPQSGPTISGVIANKENPELSVDMTPVPARDGTDVLVYKVSMKVVPGANHEYSLHFASSSTMKTQKQWGLVVGGLASEGITPPVPG